MPNSLAEQAPAFVDRWLHAHPPLGEALLHGDLHRDHVLGSGSPWRVTAVIDFSDARGGCPLYELGPIVLSVFDGDAGLLEAFLSAYGWRSADRHAFARRALATALVHDFDLFSGRRKHLAGVRSLDDLADRLFGAPT